MKKSESKRELINYFGTQSELSGPTKNNLTRTKLETRKIEEPSTRKTGSTQIRFIKCGKDKCKCRSGKAEDMHGPYKYVLVKQKWKYVGIAKDDD